MDSLVMEFKLDDVPSILLGPSRTVEGFGQMKFTPLMETALRVLEWNTFGDLDSLAVIPI